MLTKLYLEAISQIPAAALRTKKTEKHERSKRANGKPERPIFEPAGLVGGWRNDGRGGGRIQRHRAHPAITAMEKLLDGDGFGEVGASRLICCMRLRRHIFHIRFKVGAKVVRHSRKIVFQMAEVAVPKDAFRAILEGIGRLRLATRTSG